MGEDSASVKQDVVLLYKQIGCIVVPVIAGKSIKESKAELKKVVLNSTEAWPWYSKQPTELDLKQLSNKVLNRVEEVPFQIKVLRISPNEINLVFELIFDGQRFTSLMALDHSLLDEFNMKGASLIFNDLIHKSVVNLANMFDHFYGQPDNVTVKISQLLHINEYTSDYLLQKLRNLVAVYKSKNPILALENRKHVLRPVQLSLF